MKIEERECLQCFSVFKAYPKNKQRFCTIECQRGHYGGYECQSNGIEIKKDAYGTTVLGEQKKEYLSEKNPEKSMNHPKRESRPEGNIKNKDTTLMKNIEKYSAKKEENATMIIPTITMQEKQSGEKGIKNTLTRSKERGMKRIEVLSSGKSSREEEGLIPQSDSIHLSKMLKKENENSLQLLDNSARQLISYADQLAHPLTVCEETQEVIKKAPSSQVMDAVKCLDAARNMMKTKLDYMTFGQRLVERELIKNGNGRYDN